jgi:hypothetical protein
MINKAPEEIIYMVLAQATASGNNKNFKPGDRHPLLMFIRLTDDSKLIEGCNNHLYNLGWEDIAYSKSGILSDDSVQKYNEDETLSLAIKDAKINGFGITVYKNKANETA